MFINYPRFLLNNLESFSSNLGLKRTASYFWTFDEFVYNSHLVNNWSSTYGIYYFLDGKCYIGSAIDLLKRIRHHFKYPTKRTINRHLQ